MASKSTLSRDELLRSIARGELSWLQAKDHGIRVRFEGGGLSIEAPPAPPVAVNARDLALGLLAHVNDPGELRIWARVIHASSNLFDLDVERSAHGELLLDCLWRLSFGEAVQPEDIRSLGSAILEQESAG